MAREANMDRAQLVQDARAKIELNKFADGQIILDKLLSEDKDDGQVRFLRAEAAFKVGNDALAIADFEELRAAGTLTAADEKATVTRHLLEAYAFRGDLDKLDDILAAEGSQKTLPADQLASWSDAVKQARTQYDAVIKEKAKTNPNHQIILDKMSGLLQGSQRFGAKSPEWRELKASANLKLGHEQDAFVDYEEILKLSPMATHIMLELGEIKWNKTEITAAEEIWRRCVTLTEDATCRARWKEAKKALKDATASAETAKTHMKSTIKEANEALKNHQVVPAWKMTEEVVTVFAEKYQIVDPAHPVLRQIWPLQCKIASQMKNWKEVVASCEKVIQHITVIKKAKTPQDRNKQALQKKKRAFAYFKAAKAYLHLSEPQPSKAIKYLEEVQKLDGRYKGLNALYKKAKIAKEEADKFDPYKVLGVDRQATTAEIKQKYRKFALEYHPDKYRGDLTEEEVRDKFNAITRAKELLTDEEKRKYYDTHGFDPDDQQAQARAAQGGGHPFMFQQGGGGGMPFFTNMGGPGGGGGGFAEQVIYQFMQGGGGGGGPIRFGGF